MKVEIRERQTFQTILSILPIIFSVRLEHTQWCAHIYAI